MTACQLCDPQCVPDAAHDAIYTEYAAGPARALHRVAAPRAVTCAQEWGVTLTPDDVWRHFAYHRSRPRRESRRLSRPEALARTDALSPRQRCVMNLVARLGVLSAGQITAVAYRPHAASDAAARASCHRDLGVLARSNLVTRVALPSDARLAEPGRGPRVLLTPGRHATPYLERHGILSPELGHDPTRLAPWHAAHAIIATRCHDFSPWEVERWRGPHEVAVSVHLPGADVTIRAHSFLLPVAGGSGALIWRDDGGEDAADVARRFLAVVPATHALQTRWPSLTAAPVWLVVSPTPGRANDLAQACQHQWQSRPQELRPGTYISDTHSIRAHRWLNVTAMTPVSWSHILADTGLARFPHTPTRAPTLMTYAQPERLSSLA